MNMVLSIIGSVALVGISSAWGAFWVARDLGRADATRGVLFLAYSIVITGVVFFAAPHGKIPAIEDFSKVTPYVAIIGLLAGLYNGLKERRR